MNYRLPFRATLSLTALLAATTLTACSTTSTPTPSATGTASSSAATATAAATTESPAGNSSGGDSGRETAESRLGAIGTQLGTVLADYKSGKTQPAYTLAKSVSASLYEGTTEGYCSRLDITDDRQLDPLLAASLPAAIQGHEAVSQVTALVGHAQTLASGCLAAIHRSE